MGISCQLFDRLATALFPRIVAMQSWGSDMVVYSIVVVCLVMHVVWECSVHVLCGHEFVCEHILQLCTGWEVFKKAQKSGGRSSLCFHNTISSDGVSVRKMAPRKRISDFGGWLKTWSNGLMWVAIIQGFSSFGWKDGLDLGTMKIKWSTPQGRSWSTFEDPRRLAGSPRHEVAEAQTKTNGETRRKTSEEWCFGVTRNVQCLLGHRRKRMKGCSAKTQHSH